MMYSINNKQKYGEHSSSPVCYIRVGSELHRAVVEYEKIKQKESVAEAPAPPAEPEPDSLSECSSDSELEIEFMKQDAVRRYKNALSARLSRKRRKLQELMTQALITDVLHIVTNTIDCDYPTGCSRSRAAPTKKQLLDGLKKIRDIVDDYLDNPLIAKRVSKAACVKSTGSSRSLKK